MGFSKYRVPVLPIPQTASETDLNLLSLGHGAPATALRSTRWEELLHVMAPVCLYDPGGAPSPARAATSYSLLDCCVFILHRFEKNPDTVLLSTRLIFSIHSPNGKSVSDYYFPIFSAVCSDGFYVVVTCWM